MRDPWRQRCPEGHCTWTSRGERYYCNSCDDYFDELIDAKEQTGQGAIADD